MILIRRTRRFRNSVAVAGILALGLVIAPTAALAQETATTFTISLDSLAPGVTRSITEHFTLDESAKLVGFNWIERSGVMSEASADIDIAICDSNGKCVDPTAPGGVVFDAGSMQAVLDVTLSETAAAGEAGSAVGELQFTQVVDDLPFTGLDMTRLLFWGVAAMSIGAFVVRFARQSREERS